MKRPVLLTMNEVWKLAEEITTNLKSRAKEDPALNKNVLWSHVPTDWVNYIEDLGEKVSAEKHKETESSVAFLLIAIQEGHDSEMLKKSNHFKLLVDKILNDSK